MIGVRSAAATLRELSRSYLAASKDLSRVMNRLKAIYRSWAIPCAGQQVYSPRHRAVLLERQREAGVRRRAEQTSQQLDFLMEIRKETRKELLAESRKHPARLRHAYASTSQRTTLVLVLTCRRNPD